MNIKKSFLLLVSVLLLSSQIQADDIGFIDMELIFLKSSMVKNFQENIKEKQAEYQEYVIKRQEKIEKAKSKGKKQEEIDEMVAELQEDIRPKQEEMIQLERGFQQSLILSIKRTSKEVAKERQIDVVIDKQAIFFGGTDLTELVLEQLNKTN